ncbi:MAG: PQQ-binding-like beta-propeller repeat protein [Pirellulales bacterium]|nr:PQQ-binding-like beta-propeller repeat protein [Pirellulales bacterium]
MRFGNSDSRLRWPCQMAVAVFATTFLLAAPFVHAQTRLLSQEQLAPLGLARAWFAQAKLDRARHHVERAVLQGDRLTILTSAGVLQDLNALTGQSLWTAPLGNELYPSLGPACSHSHVAIVNGSTLYVLDRSDGRPILVRQVGGAPGAAPALSEKYVFVPLVCGRIEAYPLDDTKKLTPWFYQSYGRTMVAPLATPQSIVWSSDAGYLYVGNSSELGMRFRLETGSDILASPAYRKPNVYVASTSGEVFAMEELNGKRQWKFASGFTITRSPAPVGDRVFITSAEPMLHCVDAKTGTALWEAPGITQFASTSKKNAYCVDDLGALVVFDNTKGTFRGRIAASQPLFALVNDQTDWVYVVSQDGVIQCLHEHESAEPLRHTKPTPPADQPSTTPNQPATPPPPRPTAPTETTPPTPPQNPPSNSDIEADPFSS